MPDSTERASKIKTVDDIRLWILEHDTRIDAFWKAQHDLNNKRDLYEQRILQRLGALEKKVIWMAGAAAGAGSLLGVLVRALFQSQ